MELEKDGIWSWKAAQTCFMCGGRFEVFLNLSSKIISSRRYVSLCCTLPDSVPEMD